jgi:plastocyanin
MRIARGAALAVLALGCGGGGDGGNDPQPTPASISVSVSSPDAMASFGDTRDLTAVVRDAGQQVIPNAQVSWTTSTSGVVTLSAATGLTTRATAAGNGTTRVTARAGTVTDHTDLTVAQRFGELTLTPATATVAPGGTQQLTATARDARGNPIAGVTGFTFTSSDESKARVSASGLVTGVAQGTATITAALTRDGVSRTATSAITVGQSGGFPLTAAVDATGESSFSPTRVDIAQGGTVTWTFGATAHNVTFGSAAPPCGNIAASTNTSVGRTFPTAGTFEYVCTLHAGMTGSVVVH